MFDLRIAVWPHHALRNSLLAVLLVLVSGCASLESNRIQSEFQACMATIQDNADLAGAREVLDPDGGITPSMLADASYPTEVQRALFADYLDARARCERQWVEQSADSFYGADEKFWVRQRQYRLRWQTDANLLAGAMSYGEYFSEQESISQAGEEQMADIERRQALRAEQRRASVDEACASAGGRWNGLRCVPVMGDLDRKINCTTDGATTSCNI